MADDAVQAVQEEELLAAPVRGPAHELLDAGAADHFGRMRHSAAHVMAEAVMRLFPGVKLGIGPAIPVDNHERGRARCPRPGSVERAWEDTPAEPACFLGRECA